MTASDMVPAASWREENRRDRLARAQIERDREETRARLRIADRQARAAERRADAQAKTAARAQARKARAARRGRALAWLGAHTTDLLFVPVIAVPAVLAWTAMAAYGRLLYGAAGLLLPAFSEGAMWAFAAATTIRERDNRRRAQRGEPSRPAWHLRLGTVVFAAEGAALNFAHGITTTVPGASHGLVTGLVYAAVSVAGVSVHQIVTAGPRRPAAERAQARINRLAARRENAARRAAVRHAPCEVDTDGTARLVCQPGTATVARRRGRTRLHPAPSLMPVLAGPVSPWPRLAPALPAAPGGAPESAPVTAPKHAPASRRTRRPAATGTGRRRTREPVSGTTAEVHFAADLAEGIVPSARQIKKELHVGQDRARLIHDHLTAIATAPQVTSRRPA